MTIDTLTFNTKHLLHALFQSGVHYFVISPGSRTTPIALLLAEYEAQNQEIHVYIDVDERSASFFALGIAKTLQQPVVLIGTSGTAITEYFSAVTEAKISHIPLIVLSTDRPIELQDNGAPQTIPQHNIYGKLIKKAITFTLQDSNPDMTDYIDFMTQRLVHESNVNPSGPIQINLPLRKPLMPVMGDTSIIQIKQLTFKSIETNIPRQILSQKKVLFLVGPNEYENYRDMLISFSKKYHIPIIADVLSRVRTTDTVYGIDSLLKKGMIGSEYVPELVIRMGATPVSANVLKWLSKEHIPVWYVDVQSSQDHTRHISRVINVSPKTFLASAEISNSMAFYDLWLSLNQLPRNITGEMGVSQAIDKFAAKGTPIFVANSMAIRDMDDIFTGLHTQNIYANRGVNGIDGTISSALGMTASFKKRGILLTGDLSLFHDMNGLMMAKQYHINLDMIVINNNGGSIFSFLPQSEAKDYFEKMFATPLNLNIAKVADLYDIPYYKINKSEELDKILKQSITGPRIIEYKSDRVVNVKNHNNLMGV